MSINQKMAKGAAWMIGLRFFHRAVGFISTLILARLLVPADFGLVAMAMVFVHLLDALTDFSVHVPLIQSDNVDKEDMDTAWSMQLLVGGIQSIILLLLAGPIANFYQEPLLQPVIWMLSSIALIKGLKNIGVVMFQRDMHFDKDFLLMAIQRLGMFSVTMVVAFSFRSYWALVAGMLVGAVFELVLSYLMHPFRPRWCLKRWSKIFNFSRWLVINNALNFIANRCPDLILGKLMGSRSVGFFSISYEVAMLPTTELVAPINRAALPGYSRLREQNKLQRGYLDIIGMIALIALPAGVGIAATADFLVPLLLGEKWIETIPLIHNLALAGAIYALLSNGSAVFLALGKPQITTYLLMFQVILLVPGVLWAAQHGNLSDVSITYVYVIAMYVVVNLTVLLRVLNISWMCLSGYIIRPIFGCAFMYSVCQFYIAPALADYPIFLASLLSVFVGAFIYIFSVLFMWYLSGCPHKSESTVLNFIKSRVYSRGSADGC